MKIKTSITLSEELLKEIDIIISPKGNRSIFIEEAIRTFLDHKKKYLRNQNDLELINKSSDELNTEAKDVLSYQVKL